MGKPTFKSGKCRWCSEPGEVYCDNGLCDSCDSDTVFCCVCGDRQHCESKCRHVFQSHGWGEWCGSGVRADYVKMQKPFHRLLSAMGEGFARDLKSAIISGKFHTWMVGPIIGGGGSLWLYGMPERGHDWGDKLIELGESDCAEILHDGYCWLVSLYDSKTRKANQTTLAWIDRWLWPLTP